MGEGGGGRAVVGEAVVGRWSGRRRIFEQECPACLSACLPACLPDCLPAWVFGDRAWSVSAALIIGKGLKSASALPRPALPRPNQKSISLSVFTRKRERQVDLERKSKTPLCTTLLPLIAYRGEGYTTRQYHKEACRPRHYAVAKLIPT